MSKVKLGRMAYDALKGLVGWNTGAGLKKNLTRSAIQLGPELVFAGAGATFLAPEDATLAERGLLALEDVAIGLGTSRAGQASGGQIAKMTAKQGISKKDLADRIDAFSGVGDAVAGLGNIGLPRPISQGVYQQIGERMNQNQEEMAAAQQQLLEQEMLAAAALSTISPIAAGIQYGAPAVRQAVPHALDLVNI